MISKINAHPPTRQQMAAYMKACGELPPGDRDFEMHAVTWMKLFPDKAAQGFSAQFRIEALAELVTEAPIPGWAEPVADGALLTREVIFAAAAAEPVVSRKGRIAFNRASLLKRAFQIAKREE